MKLLSILSIGLLLFALSAIDKAHGDMLDLELLPETTSPGGRCMDGSMAGYYIRDGDPNLFVIFMEGGGSCSDQDKCDQRSKSRLGSSKKWENTTLGGNIFQSSDCDYNPVFCNATAVFVGYCSSDTHRGNREVASNETWGYYFSGHINFKLIIEKLISDKGLAQPGNKVLLTGKSGGAIGVMFNIDWLANRLPNVTVKGVPFAGWFTPAALEDDLPKPFVPSDYAYFANDTNGNMHYDAYMNNETVFDLWQLKDTLNKDCLADFPDDLSSLACSSAHYAYPYINSSLFHIHTQYDKYHIFSVGMAPENPSTFKEADTVERYAEMWGEATRHSLQLIVNNVTNFTKAQPDGIFSASCITHGTASTVLIDGKNFTEIVNDWFTETGNYEQFYRLIETCPLSSRELPCNIKPGCKLVLPDKWCSIDESIYNRTFYIPAGGSCWRVQIFESGTLEADSSDPGCNSDVFHSVGIYSNFNHSDGNIAYFLKAGANGYMGSFAFEQDETVVDELEYKINDWIASEKKFELTVTLPSCIEDPKFAPSMSPSASPSMIPSKTPPSLCQIEDIYNRTLYVSAASACWRVEVFDGGTLEADFSDPPCKNSTFQSAGVFSTFASGSGNSAYFEKGDRRYFGKFSFEESASVSEQEFQLVSWNATAKEYDIIITFPNCTTDD